MLIANLPNPLFFKEGFKSSELSPFEKGGIKGGFKCDFNAAMFSNEFRGEHMKELK
jgi:hypothetical protein